MSDQRPALVIDMRLRRTSKQDPNEELVRATLGFWKEAEAAGVSEEKFVEVVMEGMDKSIPQLVDRLLHDAPGMLRTRRKTLRGFERRLRKRWGLALDLYRATLEVALETGSDFSERHRPAAAGENDYLFVALTQLHGRACTTAFEVFTLLASGYAIGAQARWRTLHEIAVVANVLVENGQTNDLAERFLLHDPVERAWDAPSYQKYAASLGYEPMPAEDMNELQRVRDELVGSDPEWQEAGALPALRQVAGVDKGHVVREPHERRLHAAVQAVPIGDGRGVARIAEGGRREGLTVSPPGRT